MEAACNGSAASSSGRRLARCAAPPWRWPRIDWEQRGNRPGKPTAILPPRTSPGAAGEPAPAKAHAAMSRSSVARRRRWNLPGARERGRAVRRSLPARVGNLDPQKSSGREIPGLQIEKTAAEEISVSVLDGSESVNRFHHLKMDEAYRLSNPGPAGQGGVPRTLKFQARLARPPHPAPNVTALRRRPCTTRRYGAGLRGNRR